MEKRKTIWFSVPISTLVQSAEEKASVEIHFSYDELMEQILDENSYNPLVSSANILQDFLSIGKVKQESLTSIKCRFKQSLLKELVEHKNGYNTSVSWKDALFLALDSSNWVLNIPSDTQDEDEDNENEDDEDENEYDEETKV